MAFLRTVSTRRLLALITACVAIAIGGTAIAVAASSGGPVPKAEPLARAVHGALAGPAVTGISAHISFTNHLISSTNLGQLSSPLITGASSGRLWLSSDHQMLRLELQGNNGDAELVVNGTSFWVYDPSSSTVYKGQLPADTTAHAKSGADKSRSGGIPSISQIQTEIANLTEHLNLSGAVPGDVAGQPTYTVTVSPQHDAGLLGSVQLAFDAVHGVPLRFAVYAQGNTSPVLELTATDITYGTLKATDFGVPQPAGAKVVNISLPTGSSKTKLAHGKRHAAEATGVAAVAGKVHFALMAPSKLVGLPRQSVRLLDWGGTPAALVTYGQNLGGIAVIEQKASANATAPAASSGHDQMLALPTVSIDGVTGQELDTALGTMIRFTRAGVAYTVIGSVPPVAAEAAARGL